MRTNGVRTCSQGGLNSEGRYHSLSLTLLLEKPDISWRVTHSACPSSLSALNEQDPDCTADKPMRMADVVVNSPVIRYSGVKLKDIHLMARF